MATKNVIVIISIVLAETVDTPKTTAITTALMKTAISLMLWLIVVLSTSSHISPNILLQSSTDTAY